MKHETLTQRLGNVLFFGFAGLAALLAIISIGCFGSSVWYGGNYAVNQYKLTSFVAKSGQAPSKVQTPLDDLNSEAMWNTEAEKNAYDEAFRTGNLQVLTDKQLFKMVASGYMQDKKQNMDDAISGLWSGLGFAIAAGILYAVGRAFRYILSGV